MSLITEANLGELTSLEELVRIFLWKKNLHDHGLLKAFFIINSLYFLYLGPESGSAF